MSYKPLPQQPPILLVDDSEDDVLLVRRTFERAAVTNPLQIVRSGFEAKAYLKGDAPYQDRANHPLPALVLLDIKAPRTDASELLKWVRSQPELLGVCIVMLTSSDSIPDANLAFDREPISSWSNHWSGQPSELSTSN
jgi:CheY-like chemotaxis protein